MNPWTLDVNTLGPENPRFFVEKARDPMLVEVVIPAKPEPPKVRIRPELYERVDAIADAGRRQGVSRVGIIEEAIEYWLAARDKAPTDPGTHSRRSTETEALLAWFHHPPTDLDEALRNSIRARLKELNAQQQQTKKVNRG